jgi:DNA-binding transcriptional ArsR family regulator
MANQEAALDRVFHALANPTRRAVVKRPSEGPAAASELAEPFAMALPSFMQHLQVLEGSGLVRSEKRGRVRTYRLTPERLARAETWMERARRLWGARLDRLDAYVLELKEGDA